MERVKILYLYTGGCNNCDIEIFATLLPKFGLERLNVMFTHDPKEANIVLITGPVTKQIKPMFLEKYNMVPKPKVTIAIGSCGLSGGVFYSKKYKGYSIAGPSNKFIPIDIHVPGCPPRPDAILKGFQLAIDKLKEIL